MRNVLRSTPVVVLALIFPLAALADLSNTVTLSTSQALNLDTGVIGNFGSDILFTGSSITMQGSAGEFNSGAVGIAEYGSLTQSSLSSAPYSQMPIGGSSLVVNELFEVHTNGGNYAKVLITALSASSLTLQFDTFGVSGGISGPTITAVENNYSYLELGQANYGIAPGALFIIAGTNLASATTVSSLQSSAAPGLPTSLNGASVSVTVNGVTTNPAFYYATAAQLAVVLPSGTPVGTGTVTVTVTGTYNGQTASAPITVQPAALGLDSVSGTGTGLGNVTDNAGAAFNYTSSAAPGQNIVLWGSGLGADPADSDTVFTSAPHAVNTLLQIYIGGIPAAILYQGASGYPGLNQINVTIPQAVQPGCGIPVVAVSGAIASNTITIPVNPGGGVCSDPVLGISGSQLSALGSETNYNSGVLAISQPTGNLTPGSFAEGSFSHVPGPEGSHAPVSLGNCVVNPLINASSPVTSTPLDAGTLSLTGPAGTQVLPEAATGHYYELLPAGFIPAAGGTFTFTSTGGATPGASVGAFTATLNLGAPPVWTNLNSIATVNRAEGLTITWTGGAPNTYVVISGNSSSTPGAGASFTCDAPVAAEQFTVPSYVLEALPAGSGGVILGSQTALQTFAAPGLDYGSVVSFWAEGVSVTFN